MLLVKNLESIEMLGCVSCICLEPMDTLVKDSLSVSEVWYGGGEALFLDNLQDWDSGGISQQLSKEIDNADFKELLRTVCLSTEATFISDH